MQETNSREVVVAGCTVVCRELTVLQVRGWIEGLGRVAPDPLDGALFEDCTLDDLKLMTDLNDEKINGLRPTQIDQLIQVCKELNPHFFALLGRMAAAVRAKL